MPRLAPLYALIALLLPSPPARADDAAPYNAGVIKFCEAKLGKRVGGGECSHLADEALRVAGAEFTQVGEDGKRIPDSPNPGDYVWGKHLKTYSFDSTARKAVDSDPKIKCQPGDVLQYRGVKTADGTIAPHHTSIVRTVDAAGNPTGVYQQNLRQAKGGDPRLVVKSPLAPLKLTAGEIMVYRPSKPTNPAPIQFTWNNNSKAKKLEFTYFGKPATLGTPNTAEAYRIVWGSGPGSQSVTVDGVTYQLATRKGYEFYSTADGKIALRELEP